MADRMIFTGVLRIHFNHHGAAPLVWSIATDDWELAVADFVVTTAIHPVYRPKATPDHEDGKPSAWLETCGPARLEIVGRVAYITGLT